MSLFSHSRKTTLPPINSLAPDSGEILSAQVFVAILGASNYTYAEATWTQQLPDWIGSHVRCFDYLGGTLYVRLKQLLEQMYLAQADGTYRKLVEKISRTQLLIIDDWGLEPLTASQRSDLLELVSFLGQYVLILGQNKIPTSLFANVYLNVRKIRFEDAANIK